MNHGRRVRVLIACLSVALLPLAAAPVATAASPVPPIVAIAAGGYHTCALTSLSGVQCWGYNSAGQLGDGTTANRTKAVEVSGLSSGVSAIAAGYYHTCALTNGGGVVCWGWNHDGQLGNGTTTNAVVPRDVTGLTSGVAAIAAGGLHTCALLDVGEVRCWGSNEAGQLGDGTTTNRLVPAEVSGLTGGVTGIAAGPAHTCAIAEGGGVECWGFNSTGQVGDGSRTNRTTPVSSIPTGTFTAIAAGYGHTCGLTTEGGVTCWGWNFNGQLGNGTTTESLAAVGVKGLASGVGSIAPGDAWAHSCAVTSVKALKCWGYNANGQLGNAAAVDSSVPVDVLGLSSGVEAAAVGYYHTCALMTAGGVKCWGNNDSGALGNGTTTNSLVPVDVILASPSLPAPQLAFLGIEDYLDAFGNPYTRYRLSVLNWIDYPSELFQFSADLPACGSTPGGYRTWVNIYDVRDDARIYGFCGLQSPMDLTQIWFGLPRGTTPPTGVYITMTDQLTGSVLRSNTATIRSPTSLANASAAGAGSNRVFSVTTKAVRRGTYITWRAQMTPSAEGERVEVWMATRTSGAWSAYRKVTTRSVNAAGAAYFWYRSPIAQWVSVRFTFAGNATHAARTSPARAGRYR